MSTINHDQLFKELLTTFFIEFIDLFFPEVMEYLDTSSITFVDKEVFTDITQGNKKIYDIIALTKFQDQDYSFLVHIENQASNQTDFNQRMYRYFCNLYLTAVCKFMRDNNSSEQTSYADAMDSLNPSLF